MTSFTYLQTTEQLLSAVKEWNAEKELAIDLECENNLHHYGVFISIIQISSRSRNWIVDVLRLGEITPLLEVLDNPQIQKVFHDISFDFRILDKQFHCHPHNVFDTQMAALLLGKETLGLGSLLAECFRVQKESKFQRFDWCRRPLRSDLLEYATKDSAYLLPLRDKLIEELKAKNRLTWMEEESAYLDETAYPYQEQQYFDLSNAKRLPPKKLALLHVLFEERERTAKRLDLPNFMVFRNEVLLGLVDNPPLDVFSWKKQRGMHPLVRREAEKWLRIIRNAQEGLGETYPHQPKKLSPQQFAWKEKLMELRKKVGAQLEIRGALIMNNEQIIEIVTSKSLQSLRNWQKELVLKENLVQENFCGE